MNYLHQLQIFDVITETHDVPATPGKQDNAPGAVSLDAMRQSRALRKHREARQLMAVNLLGLAVVGVMCFFVWQNRPEGELGARPPDAQQPELEARDTLLPKAVETPSMPSGHQPSTNQSISTEVNPRQTPLLRRRHLPQKSPILRRSKSQPT